MRYIFGLNNRLFLILVEPRYFAIGSFSGDLPVLICFYFKLSLNPSACMKKLISEPLTLAEVSPVVLGDASRCLRGDLV